MAKMIVNYATNVLNSSSLRGANAESDEANQTTDEAQTTDKEWIASALPRNDNCVFADISNESEELQTYIIQACQLGIMGQDMENFLPNEVVTRAQFGTILSRLLFGTLYNDGVPYYANHLQALKENGIMTQIDTPEERIELRQWVRLMLMRSNTIM
jgi:hypothetical protein